ncbi:MAG: cytochrome C [Deltaproteobacteria bacterium]|nr:MAG: cytochrome C [Deltaproteobacteria bacterium]
MHDTGKIILGLIVFLSIVTYPVWHNAISGKAGYVPAPKVAPDKKQCVEPKQVIRIIHRDLLTDWRESVVRKGMRTYLASDAKAYPMSLNRTCMNCHTDKGEFCDQCHHYMGIKPRCWDCHNYPKGIQ